MVLQHDHSKWMKETHNVTTLQSHLANKSLEVLLAALRDDTESV